MNRKLIFQLSLFGLCMGFASVFWILPNIETYVWLAILLFSAYVIAKKCFQSYFYHGFFVGILNSIWATLIHIIYFSQYLSTHSETFSILSKLPIPYSPRISILMVGPIFGIVMGIVLGLLSMLASRIFKK